MTLYEKIESAIINGDDDFSPQELEAAHKACMFAEVKANLRAHHTNNYIDKKATALARKRLYNAKYNPPEPILFSVEDKVEICRISGRDWQKNFLAENPDFAKVSECVQTLEQINSIYPPSVHANRNFIADAPDVITGVEPRGKHVDKQIRILRVGQEGSADTVQYLNLEDFMKEFMLGIVSETKSVLAAREDSGLALEQNGTLDQNGKI